MKAVKATGSINEQGQLLLDHPLTASKNSRVEVIVLILEEPDSDETEQTKEAILEDFRQSWHQAMTGQTIPVAQIWDSIDDD
ncbi:hypothetical protein ACKFKG_04765 [Phormidesmis sp. 146-35]